MVATENRCLGSALRKLWFFHKQKWKLLPESLYSFTCINIVCCGGSAHFIVLFSIRNYIFPSVNRNDFYRQTCVYLLCKDRNECVPKIYYALQMYWKREVSNFWSEFSYLLSSTYYIRICRYKIRLTAICCCMRNANVFVCVWVFMGGRIHCWNSHNMVFSCLNESPVKTKFIAFD